MPVSDAIHDLFHFDDGLIHSLADDGVVADGYDLDSTLVVQLHDRRVRPGVDDTTCHRDLLILDRQPLRAVLAGRDPRCRNTNTPIVQSFYAQKRVNLKQIAIVIMMVVLVSTIYVHNQKKVHRNPRGGTLSFLTIMASGRKVHAVYF